ncbi:DUF1998 domain-containing protein [Staphylococcus hominis]|uniref:DUF1998 domain-containing protein n=1 Tax=Staphylococcus hominis TaxID=1290 RepID=UPI001F594B66|nr:DUF1998 domain-containing protein [Staphylococcus hominis]MCI2881997.1 DUF1998 domain-containing protein [Staphylococcus hominis]
MGAEQNINRGKLVGENGPGSIYIDTEGISYLISSADEWYKNGININIDNLKINDLRLQQILNIDYFREVPIYKKSNFNKEENNIKMELPIYRFPQLHYCKKCKYFSNFQSGSYKKRKICEVCGESQEFIQFPIVIVCEHGHIYDFPIERYVHKDSNYNSDEFYTSKHKIKIEKSGQSILNGQLKCSCGAKKSLKGITGRIQNSDLSAFQRESGLKYCSGKRTWAVDNEKDENCDGHPTAILRNALDIYNPDLVSALSITDYENEPISNYEEILSQEFDRLTGVIDEENKKLVTNTTIRGEGNSIIKSVYSIRKLEELVIQTGFSRLRGFKEEDIIKQYEVNTSKKMFSDDEINWLPVKKLYGEGIFIELNNQSLRKWEALESIVKHFENYKNNSDKVNIIEKFNSPIGVMLHTLSHGLIKEFSKVSGYASPSLKEKIYSNYNDDKFGILIYVTDTDKKGTFGGLCRLAKEEFFENCLEKSIRNMEWCSSDPVCTEIGLNTGQGLYNSNGSACHNCTYLPSTACSFQNCYLDRDLVFRLNSKVAISKYFNWLTNSNDSFDNMKTNTNSIKIIDYGEKDVFDSLDTLKSVDENIEKYISGNIKLPDFYESTIVMENDKLKVKYLWYSEKIIVLYNQNEQLEGSQLEYEFLNKYSDWDIYID